MEKIEEINYKLNEPRKKLAHFGTTNETMGEISNKKIRLNNTSATIRGGGIKRKVSEENC